MISILLIALVLLVMFVGHVIWAKHQNEAFKLRFPPISDAEFMARCSPETDPAVALKVRRIVAENLGVEYERIYPSSRFAEDLGAD
jgi:hypothetical protein